MTKPMMTIETVKKAEELIRERRHIAAAKWNGVTNADKLIYGGTRQEPADELLQWAIEEFRKRKLDALDAELRELGVDPGERDAAD